MEYSLEKSLNKTDSQISRELTKYRDVLRFKGLYPLAKDIANEERAAIINEKIKQEIIENMGNDNNFENRSKSLNNLIQREVIDKYTEELQKHREMLLNTTDLSKINEIKSKIDILGGILADKVASYSPCIKVGVGAVILDENYEVVSYGNNSEIINAQCDCQGCSKTGCKLGESMDACYALCAERQAIINAGNQNIEGKKLKMYVSLSPCDFCKSMILNEENASDEIKEVSKSLEEVLYNKLYGEDEKKYQNTIIKKNTSFQNPITSDFINPSHKSFEGEKEKLLKKRLANLSDSKNKLPEQEKVSLVVDSMNEIFSTNLLEINKEQNTINIYNNAAYLYILASKIDFIMEHGYDISSFDFLTQIYSESRKSPKNCEDFLQFIKNEIINNLDKKTLINILSKNDKLKSKIKSDENGELQIKETINNILSNQNDTQSLFKQITLNKNLYEKIDNKLIKQSINALYLKKLLLPSQIKFSDIEIFKLCKNITNDMGQAFILANTPFKEIENINFATGKIDTGNLHLEKIDPKQIAKLKRMLYTRENNLRVLEKLNTFFNAFGNSSELSKLKMLPNKNLAIEEELKKIYQPLIPGEKIIVQELEEKILFSIKKVENLFTPSIRQYDKKKTTKRKILKPYLEDYFAIKINAKQPSDFTDVKLSNQKIEPQIFQALRTTLEIGHAEQKYINKISDFCGKDIKYIMKAGSSWWGKYIMTRDIGSPVVSGKKLTEEAKKNSQKISKNKNYYKGNFSPIYAEKKQINESGSDGFSLENKYIDVKLSDSDMDSVYTDNFLYNMSDENLDKFIKEVLSPEQEKYAQKYQTKKVSDNKEKLKNFIENHNLFKQGKTDYKVIAQEMKTFSELSGMDIGLKIIFQSDFDKIYNKSFYEKLLEVNNFENKINQKKELEKIAKENGLYYQKIKGLVVSRDGIDKDFIYSAKQEKQAEKDDIYNAELNLFYAPTFDDSYKISKIEDNNIFIEVKNNKTKQFEIVSIDQIISEKIQSKGKDIRPLSGEDGKLGFYSDRYVTYKYEIDYEKNEINIIKWLPFYGFTNDNKIVLGYTPDQVYTSNTLYPSDNNEEGPKTQIDDLIKYFHDQKCYPYNLRKMTMETRKEFME